METFGLSPSFDFGKLSVATTYEKLNVTDLESFSHAGQSNEQLDIIKVGKSRICNPIFLSDINADSKEKEKE